jgi:hypothetical protein
VLTAGQRSPTGCSSSASGTCGRSWPSTRPITTDVVPIAAASSARPGPITRSRTLPRNGSSVDPSWRPHWRIRAIRIKAQLGADGRVLEPHSHLVLVLRNLAVS